MSDRNQSEPLTYRRTDIAERLSVSVQSIGRLVERGVLPKPMIQSGKILRWSRSEVDAALHGPLVGGE
jgi:excisionase family DNA binding protein